MYTLISLFYVSILGIAGMILYKRHEVKTGKPTILSKLGQGSDHFFYTIFNAVGSFFSYINKHTFIALAQWMAIHVLKYIRGWYVEIKHMFISTPQGKKMLDAVRGRGQVKDHGASFYLRRIGETEGRK